MNNDYAPNGRAKVSVALIGEDGNAMFIVSRCLKAMRNAHWPESDRHAFANEAVSGDYDHLLQTVFLYCNDASDASDAPEDEPDEEPEELHPDDDTDDDSEDDPLPPGIGRVSEAHPPSNHWARRSAGHSPMRRRRRRHQARAFRYAHG